MGPRDSDTGEQRGQWNCPSPEHPGADRRLPTPQHKTEHTLNTKRWWCLLHGRDPTARRAVAEGLLWQSTGSVAGMPGDGLLWAEGGACRRGRVI